MRHIEAQSLCSFMLPSGSPGTLAVLVSSSQGVGMFVQPFLRQFRTLPAFLSWPLLQGADHSLDYITSPEEGKEVGVSGCCWLEVLRQFLATICYRKWPSLTLKSCKKRQ